MSEIRERAPFAVSGRRRRAPRSPRAGRPTRRTHETVETPQPSGTTVGPMSAAPNNTISVDRLLVELEPVVAQNLDRHLSMARSGTPTTTSRGAEGRDFAFLGGEDWAPEQSRLVRDRQGRDVHQPAHRGQPALLPPRDRDPLRPRRRVGHVGRPLDRGGEPARHRDARLPRRHPRRRPGRARAGPDGLHDRRLRLRRQDAAARRWPTCPSRSWRPGSRTATPARSTGDPIAEQMLARIANDENLHMVFYRNIVAAAFEIDARRDDAARSPTRSIGFEMPGATWPASGATR